MKVMSHHILQLNKFILNRYPNAPLEKKKFISLLIVNVIIHHNMSLIIVKTKKDLQTKKLEQSKFFFFLP